MSSRSSVSKLSSTHEPHRSVDQENDPPHPPSTLTIFRSITYILTIGISGLILCAVGSNLSSIASIVNVSSTSLGGRAFMCRGCGAVLGALASTHIYQSYPGDAVLLIGLTSIAAILTLIPHAGHASQVYIYFFGLGICSSINDTGCNIMMRTLHGLQAGPWLGMNGISFGMSAAIVPIVELVSSDILIQYRILAFLIILIAGLVLYGITQDTSSKSTSKNGRDKISARINDESAPHYYVEMLLALCVFCLVGGQVDTVAYINVYVEQTGVITGPARKSVVLVFWLFVSIGRLIGVIDQRYLTNSSLVNHLSICCCLGAIFMILPIIIPSSPISLWIAIIGYSLFYGPTVAYCHDLNNRLTLPTERSTAIVMFGINCGASFVPYITSSIWELTGSPRSLLVFIFLSMLLPLPLAVSAPTMSYVSHSSAFSPSGRSSPRQSSAV